MNHQRAEPLITIVIPCYNEEQIIEKSMSVITRYVKEATSSYEIVVVDDGSTDNTFTKIKELANKNSNIRGIQFTRHFGKESAIHAGLDSSRGAATVIIDADLQHPPELLPTLFRYWKEENFQVVEAVKSFAGRSKRLSNLWSSIFNFMMSKFTGLKMHGASDYKLLDRKVVQELLEMPERNRFFRGLVDWTGYRTKQVPFEVQQRVGGDTKWSFLSLFKLSISATTSFSNIPLQLITGLGTFTLLFSFVLGVQTLYNKLTGQAVSGFATVIVLSLLLNSVIMISLGIIGTYLANIYMETKNRPFYVITENTFNEKSSVRTNQQLEPE